MGDVIDSTICISMIYLYLYLYLYTDGVNFQHSRLLGVKKNLP